MQHNGYKNTRKKLYDYLQSLLTGEWSKKKYTCIFSMDMHRQLQQAYSSFVMDTGCNK